MRLLRALLALVLPLIGCSDSGQSGGGHDGGNLPQDGAASFDANGDGFVAPPTGTTCMPPIALADTTGATVVKTCSEAEFATALANGGAITFDCGGPKTIAITAEKKLPTNKGNITIDGGGQITLDGGGAARIFSFDGGNWRTTGTTITLQRLTIQNAKATGTMQFPVVNPNPNNCAQGYKDGGGGAILIRDGVLHVIDVTFTNNQAAYPGPDVAGGAIYALGSKDVTVVGSRFNGNSGSNGGAIGALWANLNLVNDAFSQNQALGMGENGTSNACGTGGMMGQTGAGGNGGAISIDGGEANSDGSPTIQLCGDVFSQNRANALAGAIFRTPDISKQETRITQSTFDGNQAQGGGALYFHNSTLAISDSTFSNNAANGAGAIQADGTTLDLTNVTLAGNRATASPGGAISLFGNDGHLLNCTFQGNQAAGPAGKSFAAAIFGGTTLTIDNTIFDGQTSNDANAPQTCQGNTGANDLQWPATHSTGGSPDQACVAGIAFVDPLLGPLQDNGGPTLTLEPAAGSAAIGKGASCPDHDQRLMPRNTAHCTVGAVEAQ